MFDLNKLIRPNILKLSPYTSARDEFSGEADIFLDANENAYGSATAENHNRYPDPKHIALRNRLSELNGQNPASVFVGNGSDEAIDLIIRLFCVPGTDSILTLHPSYGMYKVSADINDIAVKIVNLNEDYTLDPQSVIKSMDRNVKVIFICNPNNPTGNAFSKAALEKIAEASAEKNAILVVDEAYIDFCEKHSMLPELSRFPNLIVLRTLSKAWGLAEIRLGIAFASEDIINYLYKIKAPYNVNGVSQQIALKALANPPRKNEMVKSLIKERDKLIMALKEAEEVEKVHPSDANYIFVKVKNPVTKFQELLKKGIVVRDRSKVSMCEGCFRITVGTTEENEALLAAFSKNDIKAPKVKSIVNTAMARSAFPERRSEISRKTSETDVRIKINLDGGGEGQIETGLSFFDHMLQQITKHSGINLELKVKGDLKVDEHHTIEDTAIGLGEAFLKALGDKHGIERYGFILPMDECLAQVAIDFSGRSCLVWEAEFKREKIGDMPTEMFSHFFKSFSDAAKCNLNIKAEGGNEHHKIEAIFKAFAKCIKQAVRRDPLNLGIPSSKGIL
jgi:histidinol-phosphate aminotransferase